MLDVGIVYPYPLSYRHEYGLLRDTIDIYLRLFNRETHTFRLAYAVHVSSEEMLVIGIEHRYACFTLGTGHRDMIVPRDQPS